MAVSNNSTRLGCGRDIDDVWASIDQPPNEHEQGCLDCQRARANLSRLASITTAQRQIDPRNPELQPDPQVLVRIIDLARAEVRRGRRLPLDEPTHAQLVSSLTVSEQAVAAVVRHAGDSIPGVQIRRVAIALPPPLETEVPRPEATGAPGGSTGDEPDARPARVAVSLQISVPATVAIPALCEELRRAVMAAVENEVGLDTIMIDIAVVDVDDE